MKAIASSCLPLLFLFILSSFLLLSFSARKGKTKERQVDYGLFGTGQRSPHHQNLDILNLKNYEEQGMIEMVFWPCPTCRFIHPVGPGRTRHCSKGLSIGCMCAELLQKLAVLAIAKKEHHALESLKMELYQVSSNPYFSHQMHVQRKVLTAYSPSF